MTSKPTFLNQSRPLLTCLIQNSSVADAVNIAINASYECPDAYAYQLECLAKEERTDENIRRIFGAMGRKPIYVTNYRGGKNGGDTDEQLSEGLFWILKNGATLLDVMGDYYCPHPIQMTDDPTAVDRQKDLIARIHDAGGEVLMSSHVMKFIPAEEVIEIANKQIERGADVVKIVTAANSEEEEFENLRTTMLMKQQVKAPFLFLSGGSHNKLHRQLGIYFGCSLALTVYNHQPGTTPAQPRLAGMRKVMDGLNTNGIF